MHLKNWPIELTQMTTAFACSVLSLCHHTRLYVIYLYLVLCSNFRQYIFI